MHFRYLSFILSISVLTPALAPAQVELEYVLSGSASGDQYGYSVASAGDFNGDGYDDLIVGANANTEGGTGAGKVYVYFGGPSSDSIADWTKVGIPSELLGTEVAGAGDINRDGYDDILIGAPSNDQNGTSAGHALLFFGGNPPDTVADWSAYGEHAIDLFGSALAGGRDLTGDDTADFIVGAYRFDTAGQSNTGKIYIYAGGTAPSTTPWLTTAGFSPSERYGHGLAITDDFTGDGFADYCVGAYSYDSGAPGTNAGRVLLMQAGPFNLSVPVGEWDGTSAGEFFGWTLADAGDVNGDGASDILVGAHGYAVGLTLNAGRACLYFGGPALDSAADFILTSTGVHSENLGYSVAGGTDLTGDGKSEFAIGAPGESGGNDFGKAYLYRGASTPILDTTLEASGNGTYFGSRIALVSRFFGAAGAVVVGAWGENSAQGAVYVYQYIGGSLADTIPPAATLTAPNGGDSLVAGSLYAVAWNSSDNVGIIATRLDFSSDSGSTWGVIDSIAGNPSAYYWTIPDTATDLALVRVTVYDFGTNQAVDTSDAVFTIYKIPQLRGDVDKSGLITSADIIYLVNYAFRSGPEPIGGMAVGDVNCNGAVNSADIIYLVGYIFKGGPAPCPL